MQPHRIIAVTTHNDKGGAHEALTRLCRMLRQRGHDVDLWYLYKRGNSSNPQFAGRFVLDRENPSLIDYMRILLRFAKILSKERPNALISFLPLANVLGQTLAWIIQIPVRIASQRNPVQTYSATMKFLDWYFGTCGSYTDNVVNSSDVRLSVSRYPWPYRTRTSTIYNGIEPTLNDGFDRKNSRKHFNIGRDEVALVSVGRLTKQKNHVLLIQILGALENFRLLIAGSGPELNKLRTEAYRMGVDSRVSFLGNLDRSEMNSLLQASDVFALPSIYEGQSNALLEAMSVGKPIVASDILSNRETLVDENCKAGFVLPITEPNLWIATLRELGGDISKRNEMARIAKERSQKFTLDRTCSGFEAIIEASSSKKRIRHHGVFQS